jgi:succinyl-CoA synthetase beta subunit
MDLLEHEGKRVFARYGITVPRGALWPEVPAGLSNYVVKAQMRRGGRGKRGGIRFVDTADAVDAVARQMADEHLGTVAIEGVYIEERLAIRRELYLAVAIDRNRRCRVLLASRHGGVDIEDVPDKEILRMPVDPTHDLAPVVASQVARFLDEAGGQHDTIEATVRALYALAVAEDAMVAEINPLVVTDGGGVVAADAKLSLDERARFRHSDWEAFSAPPQGSEIERALAEAGGAAVEIDPTGNVVGVISGAGLMMATLDLMVGHGIRVRCVIDMGGTPLGGAEGLVPIFQAVAAMRPEVTFINAYFHTALAESFAHGVVGAAETAPLPGRVVLRLLGRNAEAGRAILAPLGFVVHDDLTEALEAVAGATQRSG